MMTLRQLAKRPQSIPTSTSWYLADIGEARGKYELFLHQSPQVLKSLREHALIQSAVASNRIEGVEIDRARVKPVILGKPVLRDRNEEEVRGYRDALKLIHEKHEKLAVSEKVLLRLHRTLRGKIWDAGTYKKRDIDITQTLATGEIKTRFRTVPAGKTLDSVRELMKLWDLGVAEAWVHPLVLLAGFNLDLLCIHPFRDGNGRVSRLMLLLQCYHLGHEVGRYVSLERLIEENKERYYETLESCSRGWHQGRHDPWPYVNYLLFILKSAYQELEVGFGQTRAPRGAKSELVRRAVARLPDPFRFSDVRRACAGVSVDMIRRVLRLLKGQGLVECLNRGQLACWRKTEKWELGNSGRN
jgi:Fic family protein